MWRIGRRRKVLGRGISKYYSRVSRGSSAFSCHTETLPSLKWMVIALNLTAYPYLLAVHEFRIYRLIRHPSYPI